MSSGSYTIALSSPPCEALDWSLAVAAIPSIDQDFSVLQTFQAGVAIAGPALCSGIVTFEQSPVFEAGITVPSELNLGALTVSGLSTLSGGIVCGAPASFSDMVTCAAGLTVSYNGINVTGDIYTDAYVSTACLVVRELGANIVGPVDITGTLHVTADSTLDGALSVAGLVSCSAGLAIAGSVDITGSLHATEDVVLDAALSVSGLVSCSDGLAVAGPMTAVAAAFSGQVSASGGLAVVGTCELPATTLSGALIGTSATFSGVLSCASEVDAGVASFGGLVSANAGLAIAGPLVLPQLQGVIVPGSVIAVNLANSSCNFFTLAMTSNVAAFTFANMLVNASFVIFLTVGVSARTMNKALSSGGCTCYNNLSGNTSMAANSRWCIRGVVVSASVVYLEFLNVT